MPNALTAHCDFRVPVSRFLSGKLIQRRTWSEKLRKNFGETERRTDSQILIFFKCRHGLVVNSETILLLEF